MTLIDAILGRKLDLTAADLAPTPTRNPSAIASPPQWSDRSHFYAATFADLFDLDYLPVNRDTGMGLGVLARARHLTATTIGNFPLVGMAGQSRMPRQPQICQQPEIGRARSTTLIWAVDAMFWYGRVWYVVTERYAEDNRPRRVQWVPEWQAQVDESGLLVKAFGRPVSQVDVIRVDGPHEGILNFGAGAIREALAIQAAAANASDNPVPSINLHQTGGDPLTNEQIGELTARWTAARRKRGGGVAFTNQSVEAIAMGVQPEQLLIAAKQASDLQLVRLAGLPAWAADVSIEGSNLTYSNSPSRARELIDFGLTGYMTAWTDRFSMDDILPAGQWCRFDTTAILQGNFKERMEGYQIAVAAGIYTPEQCRQIEEGIALEGA